jgi:hypothetical protein
MATTTRRLPGERRAELCTHGHSGQLIHVGAKTWRVLADIYLTQWARDHLHDTATHCPCHSKKTPTPQDLATGAQRLAELRNVAFTFQTVANGDQGDGIRVSRETLAQRCGYMKAKNIDRPLQNLERLGWIECTQYRPPASAGSNGRQPPNEYRLTIPTTLLDHIQADMRVDGQVQHNAAREVSAILQCLDLNDQTVQEWLARARPATGPHGEGSPTRDTN